MSVTNMIYFSAVGMLNALGNDTLAMQVVSALLGVGLMALLAAWLDWNKRLGQPPSVERVQPQR